MFETFNYCYLWKVIENILLKILYLCNYFSQKIAQLILENIP